MDDDGSRIGIIIIVHVIMMVIIVINIDAYVHYVWYQNEWMDEDLDRDADGVAVLMDEDKTDVSVVVAGMT